MSRQAPGRTPERGADRRRQGGTAAISSRLITGVTVVVAAVAAFFAISRSHITSPGPPSLRIVLPPHPESYLGVFVNGAPPAYQPVATFAQAAGVRPNIVGYYSGWAQPFAASFAQNLHRHGAIPFVQIDPTLASVAGIARGAYDDYLSAYADSVRDFGHAVIVGFGHEMNAPTYSWGYHHVKPQTFTAAWRHIVTLFRGRGAGNITWLWTLQADRQGTGPVSAWWPGARYVSWVGIDGYYYRPSDTFASVFGRTIAEIRKLTKQPVLLSETAVGPRAGQFTKINDLFRGIRKSGALGVVWFDKTQHDGLYHQDWRIEDNPGAAASFQLGVADLRLAQVSPARG
jgi:mannan endo-1,4-beta-mannosidase